MLHTWSQAALDLGFTFISPVILSDDDLKVECFAHLPQFGSPKGILLFEQYNANHCKLAKRLAYAYACIVEYPEPYDRGGFIDMLSDWGWSDPNHEPPSWYLGQPYLPD